ncbi:hypothetical protein ACGFNY_43910 [Streptomyces chartreusis]|uniref:hypothetical protein n=1 Tax=Streptomyces chartreusis TaxID=1969 RepID=UPI003715EABA
MTGAEFAKNHGNDSSNWTSADFEALEVLVDIDLQPVWVLLKRDRKRTPDPQPTTPLTPAA